MAWNGLNPTTTEEGPTLQEYLHLWRNATQIPIWQNEICKKEIKIAKPRMQSSRNGGYWFTLAALEPKTF